MFDFPAAGSVAEMCICVSGVVCDCHGNPSLIIGNASLLISPTLRGNMVSFAQCFLHPTRRLSGRARSWGASPAVNPLIVSIARTQFATQLVLVFILVSDPAHFLKQICMLLGTFAGTFPRTVLYIVLGSISQDSALTRFARTLPNEIGWDNASAMSAMSRCRILPWQTPQVMCLSQEISFPMSRVTKQIIDWSIAP